MKSRCCLLFVATMTVAWSQAADFFAYRTRLDSPEGKLTGEYADLVVVLGPGKRLEFANANAYLPQWRTPVGVYPVENLFPDQKADTFCNYSYARLVEQSLEKIVVHWRHFNGIEAIGQANQALDSLNPRGITGAVHEMFTIRPDGSVEREVREAANTRYQDWIDPRLAARQSLKLTETGVASGPVKPGQKPPFYPRAVALGNPVKARQGLPAPILRWTFDDGLKPHDDTAKETVSNTASEITGLMTLFKKGVSGTALALDGYYAGVAHKAAPATYEVLTVEAWVALDTYPYNTAPLIHHSTGVGKEGWYLGLDAYGHPVVKVGGKLVKAAEVVLPLHQWSHVCASIGNGKVRLYVDGREVAAGDARTPISAPTTPLLLGRNNEPERCTDAVRNDKRNLEFVFGIQGLLDEVSVYGSTLSSEQVKQAYEALRPATPTSDLAKGVLPGKTGAAKQFGASYQTLAFSEVWDPLWRDAPGSEIVVKFDRNPCSVVYWRGTNGAPNWVTDNNRWMADQSSEGGGPHGCSEHMADKQVRHCRAEILENTPARVKILWRYPCVDVSYTNLNPGGWSDEYHTIYPDGTGVRKVVWNAAGNKGGGPGFQDIQFLTNPGEWALDVMNRQAMTVANLGGETRELHWGEDRKVPGNPIDDACIELLNSKSEYKVFAMFQGGFIKPWGNGEQSKYTKDPFAGPWNHWPMHLVPSDGRFAVASDRVMHFALGANDQAPKFGSMVLYGFSHQPISTLLPVARSWLRPPAITAISGCTTNGYKKEAREFSLVAAKPEMTARIDATAESPIASLCLSIKNWGHAKPAIVKVAGGIPKEVRQGTVVDTDGTRTLLVWLDLTATVPVSLTISGANPQPKYPAKE